MSLASSDGGSANSEPPDSEADGEEDDADDWSGDNDSLDATVIAAVEGDLRLAAFLIPLLHRDLRSAARTKVESWQYTAAGADSSVGGGAFGSPTSSEQSPNRSRKRRRQSNSGGNRGAGDDGDDDGDGDDGEHPDNVSGLPGTLDEHLVLYLACPFHKQNPAKYSIQHGPLLHGHKKDFYRSCAGPGFRSIQRLK